MAEVKQLAKQVDVAKLRSIFEDLLGPITSGLFSQLTFRKLKTVIKTLSLLYLQVGRANGNLTSSGSQKTIY